MNSYFLENLQHSTFSLQSIHKIFSLLPLVFSLFTKPSAFGRQSSLYPLGCPNQG